MRPEDRFFRFSTRRWRQDRRARQQNNYTYFFLQGRGKRGQGSTAAVLAAHRARYEGDQRCFVLPGLLWEEARRVAVKRSVCQNRTTDKK